MVRDLHHKKLPN